MEKYYCRLLLLLFESEITVTLLHSRYFRDNSYFRFIFTPKYKLKLNIYDFIVILAI